MNPTKTALAGGPRKDSDMETIRTEQTSKWLKGGMVLGVALVLTSLVLAYQSWGTPTAQYAIYGGAAGVGVWLAARFAAWWQYG